MGALVIHSARGSASYCQISHYLSSSLNEASKFENSIPTPSYWQGLNSRHCTLKAPKTNQPITTRPDLVQYLDTGLRLTKIVLGLKFMRILPGHIPDHHNSLLPSSYKLYMLFLWIFGILFTYLIKWADHISWVTLWNISKYKYSDELMWLYSSKSNTYINDAIVHCLYKNLTFT